MAPIDHKTEVVPPAEVPEDLPLPADPKVIFLGGLFVLAMLAAAYVVSEIVLPLVFAIVLKLLLQPALRVLERLHVPRILAALLLILALFGTIVGVGTAISGPARTWAAKLPEGIPRLEERLSFMRAPINTLQLFLQQLENIGETGPSPNGAISERGATFFRKFAPMASQLHAVSERYQVGSFRYEPTAIFLTGGSAEKSLFYESETLEHLLQSTWSSGADVGQLDAIGA